jgi:uncharacterized protein YcbX
MLGTVTALYRYPVKSLRVEALTVADVRPDGFAGDRAAALFVSSPEHARTGKTYRGKENRRLHMVAAIDDAHEIARGAGVTLEVAEAAPHYFDLEPVSIVFDAWIRELEALAGRAVDPLRFRPNIVAAASPGFTASEGDLVGARVHIGAVVFDIVSRITRCVTPSYDVTTGEPDPALQRTIVTQRENIMGVYARVVVPGSLTRGDTITAA